MKTSNEKQKENWECLLNFCADFNTVAPLVMIGFSKKDARALVNLLRRKAAEDRKKLYAKLSQENADVKDWLIDAQSEEARMKIC